MSRRALWGKEEFMRIGDFHEAVLFFGGMLFRFFPGTTLFLLFTGRCEKKTQGKTLENIKDFSNLVNP